MSYLVLARKYRPKTFREVAGQDVLVRVLAGAIEEERVGHAYLFCGPRGTGKTTTARLLAKCLNCEQGPTAEPCGTCERCKASDEGREVDVIEIDAASHTGVDNIRELRDQVGYAPMRARFKVYIIDEVHMLSTGASNALLKTLEEPPSHVKFFLATTEPEKLLDTIHSRCQVMRLSLIPEEVIATTLGGILESEGVEPGEGVLEELALAARGSMRDALTLADQLLALVGDRPAVEDVRRLGAASGGQRIDEILSRVEAGDPPGVLEALPEVEGGEPELLSAILDHLRGVLLAGLDPRSSRLAEADPRERERRSERAKRLGPERIQLWLEDLLGARERMRHLKHHARLILEVALLDLCREEASLPLAELEQRLLDLEARLQDVSEEPPAGRAPSRPPPAPQPRSRPEPAPASPRSEPDPPAAEPEPTPPEPEPPPTRPEPPPPRPARRTPATSPRAVASSSQAAWSAFLAELGRGDEGLARILEKKARLVDYGEGGARLQLRRASARDRERIRDEASRKACEQAFSAVAGREVRIAWEDTAGRRPGSDDPFTNAVSELFNGHIEDDS